MTFRSFQNKGFECSNIPVVFALQDSLCMSSQKLMYELTTKGQCSLVLHENKSLTDCDLQFLGGLCTLQSSFHDRGVKSILGFGKRACLQDRRRQFELITHMFFLLFYYTAALNWEIKMFWILINNGLHFGLVSEKRSKNRKYSEIWWFMFDINCSL